MQLKRAISKFVKRHWRDISRGGNKALQLKFIILLRMFKNVLVLISISPIFLLSLLVIRCMRPWLLIRFGEIESSGIGHLALPIEIYLSEVEHNLHNPDQKFFDIWFTHSIISNRVLLNKWAQILTIWPRWIIKPISLLNRLIPGGERHVIAYRHLRDSLTPWQYCDIHSVLSSTRPHIIFLKEEESEGFSALKKMGIGKNDSIICFMARDKAFHSEEHSNCDHRNSSVHAIVQALDGLNLRGYKAIRMGSKVIEPLHSTNPLIIDYATNGMRTELLDLFLISRCRFMVSTSTGFDGLATTFRHPLVYVNVADFGPADTWGSDLILIPKRFWSIAEKRFLTFREIFRLGAHFFAWTWQYKREGIEWVDNDVDEIRAVILEMEQRLSGSWVTHPEDELLQNQFRSLWPTRPAGRNILQSRIGAEFLRQNRELLI